MLEVRIMTELVLEVTPAQAVEQLERGLGLSRSELAGALGASPRTVERWSGGARARRTPSAARDGAWPH